MSAWSMTPQLIIAAIVAALGFGSAWQIQDWRYKAKEADRDRQTYETSLESERLAHRAQTQDDQRVINAQNAAALRQRVLRADADASRTALIGLSTAASEALSRANDSHNACLNTASAQSVVLNQCAVEYRGLAEDADRILSDRQTLINAWPSGN